MADSASSTNALEADIREDCDELADGRSGRSAFLSDIKPSDQRCVTRVGRLCDLTGKLSLSTEEFRLVSISSGRIPRRLRRRPVGNRLLGKAQFIPRSLLRGGLIADTTDYQH